MLQDHACNAYCSGDEHCELVYTTPFAGGEESAMLHIGDAYKRRHGVTVTRVQEAREAPGIEAIQSPMRVDSMYGNEVQDGQRWLVWWRR